MSNEHTNNSNNNFLRMMNGENVEQEQQQQQQTQRIVEDAPRMRSMQVKPVTPALMKPLKPASFAKRPPTQLVSQQIPLFRQQEHEKSFSSGWKVLSLKPLPAIHMLERTHVICEDTPANVSSKIAECLRVNSMAANYHNEEACADVETVDCIKFSVRLWVSDEDSNRILVEVQRVAGCSFSFCQAAKTVLRAAKGLPASSSLKRAMPRCVPTADPKESKAATRDGLEVAQQLWQQRRLDTRILALQSVEQISRCPDVANRAYAASLILSSQHAMFAALLDLIQMTPASEPSTEEQHFFQMRRWAFLILNNCLGSLSQAGELHALLRREPQLTSKPVLEAFKAELTSAQSRPHEAWQVAECLRAIQTASSMHCNLSDAVAYAHQVGTCRHAGLERACAKFPAPLRRRVVE